MQITATELVRGLKARRAAVLPVAVLSVLAFGIYVFLEIADEVTEGESRDIDEMLFLLFRNPLDTSDPLGPVWLEETAAEITALGGYPVIIGAVLAVAGLLVLTRRYGQALYTVVSVGGGAFVSQVLKTYYERPRPDIVEHLDTVHTASFPSGHAMLSAVAYLTLATLVLRYFADIRVRLYVVGLAVAVTFLIGLTRIYLGVHWPSDVVAGWALGTAWACLAWLVVSSLQLYRTRHWSSRDGR